MTALFRPSQDPQKARMCPQNRPMAGRRAIHAAVPSRVSAALSAIRRGPRWRPTKARCGVMSPPRQPRWRTASRAGGSGFLSIRVPEPATLEVEENTDGASEAVVGRFLVLLQVEVKAPVGAHPLSPASGDGVFWKIENYIGKQGSGNNRSGSNNLVSFAAPLIAKRDEVFLVMTLLKRDVLSAGEDVPGIGVSPHQSRLQDNGIFEIVSALRDNTNVTGAYVVAD